MRREGLRPVAREKRCDGLVGPVLTENRDPGPQGKAGEGGKRRPAGPAQVQPQGLPPGPPPPPLSLAPVPPRLYDLSSRMILLAWIA